MQNALPLRRVTVVDDDDQIRLALRSLLRSSGFQVEDYGSAEHYLDGSLSDPDCLIVDVSMPGRSGPELVRELYASGREVPALFITAHGLPDGELGGQHPLLQKPFADDQLLFAVRELCDGSAQARPQDDGATPAGLHTDVERKPTMKANPLRAIDDRPSEPAHDERGRGRPGRGFARIVGSDSGLTETVHRAELLTRWNAPLLLQGETGVGKELFARALHEAAPGARAEAPFVALHCSGLPPELLSRELFGYVAGAFEGAGSEGRVGRLEAAHGGTLFLDEIGDLSPELQTYLLRVLESGEFYPLGSEQPRKTQFRLIAASRSDLREATSSGRFRSDLFFRIAATSLTIPPLRERAEDVPPLVEHFAAEIAARSGQPVKTFTPATLLVFARYDWPGNVRELRSVVESLCLLAESDSIEPGLLPAELSPRASVTLLSPLPASDGSQVELPRGLQAVERAAIQDALRRYAGNLTRVAQELQIARSTLYLKLKKYELDTVLTELRVTRS